MTRSKGPALILVRHGETVGESSIRYHGRTDVALSALGREQMRAAKVAVAARHGGPEFTRVFASPLSRAAEGARLIAGASAPVDTLDEFVEVDFGLFEGLTADEILERYPEEAARWNADRLAPAYAYPRGESRAAFAERVERGVDRMLAIWNPGAGNIDQRALLVAHRGVIRAIVSRLVSAEPIVELGSIQILELDGTWHATALDITDHLNAVVRKP
ncbi:MAG TPA: histidine phosphatase family protein [Candidatus Binataceae bacterium]